MTDGADAPKPTVLIAEDNKQTRALLKRFFEKFLGVFRDKSVLTGFLSHLFYTGVIYVPGSEAIT